MGVAFVESAGPTAAPQCLHKQEIHHELRRLDAKGKPKGKQKHPLDRWGEYVLSLEPLIKEYQPTLVVIENYGFAGHGLAKLVEQATIIRYFLRQWGYDYQLLPPTSLKKFATGKGNAGKGTVMKEVLRRWAIDCETDNEADAVALAFAGLGAHGLLPNMPAPNLAALDKLSDPAAD